MPEEVQNQSVSKKKGKGGLIVVICISVVVIAVLTGVIVYLLTHRQADNGAAEEDPGRGVVVNKDNAEEIAESLSEPTPPGMYEVVMNSSWTFPSGEEASTNAYVENSTSNQQPVYFDVTLEDTGETIFESPILPVGTHLDSEDIKLNRDLDAGFYNALITYHLLDDEGNSTSSVKLTLSISIDK